MAILLTRNFNGSLVGYYKAVHLKPMIDTLSATVYVVGWSDEDAHLAGQSSIWSSEITVPLADLGDLDGVILQLPGFSSGVRVTPKDGTLPTAKARQWEVIKQAREQAISANMVTPYGTIQCRSEDRQNITDAIMLAQTLTATGEPVHIDWTMADNTVVALDADQLRNIGMLLGQKVQAAHARARELRTAIENGSSLAEVNAVAWGQ